ncbi:MAG: hypothetical protein LBB28_03655 [Synergistaceae bacterium]|nr:hypothetical protein [Synergistaceae bacterium]
MGRNGNSLYMYRRLIGGRAQIVPCKTSFMTSGDIEEAVKLHRRVTSGLSPEIFAPTGERDIERLVGGDGVSFGVWFEKRLICMRAVIVDGDWVNETLAHMGLGEDEQNRTVYTDHCIVDREFRGNNVQFLTHYAIEQKIAGRYDVFFTTVSPKNSFSLQNILGCNFVIVGIKKLYGGYLRYVMRKKLSTGLPIWTHGHLVIPISDIARQQEAIADGCVGYKMIRKHRGFSVLYAPMAERSPKGYWKNMAVGKNTARAQSSAA